MLLIHFPPFQFHAWVTVFCTCIAPPKSTHSTFVTGQVSKRLVICNLLQVGSVAQSARQRMRVGCCSSTRSYLWEAHMHSVLQHCPFLLCCHLILPTDPWWRLPLFCKSPCPRLFLQSKVGREHFPGKEELCLDVPQQQRWRRPGWRTLSAT